MPSKPNPQDEALAQHAAELAKLREAIEDNTAALLSVDERLRRLEPTAPELVAEVAAAIQRPALTNVPDHEGVGDEEPQPEAPEVAETSEAKEPAEEKPEEPASDKLAESGERPARRTDYRGIAVVGPDFVQIGPDRRQAKVDNAAQALNLAQHLDKDPGGSVRQVWILAETCTQLGLEVWPEDEDAPSGEQRGSVLRQLATAGEKFVAPALEQGWQITKGETTSTALTPRTLFKRGSQQDAELVHLVLEPYLWVNDDSDASMVGLEERGTLLNDDDPVDRAEQIIERSGWIYEHFGVLPGYNAGHTMQQVVDLVARSKKRKAGRGEFTTDRAGRQRLRVVTEPGVVPKMDGPASSGKAEEQIAWFRGPSETEIAEAEEILSLDQRRAFPASAGGTVLGYGEPYWVEGAEAIAKAVEAAGKESVAGIWRCENYADWHEPRIMPPHHLLGHPDKPVMWMTHPTVGICLADEDQRGAGLQVDDLGITGAWIYPESGKVLQPWYNRYRKAVLSLPTEQSPETRRWAHDMLQLGGRALIGKLAYLPPEVKDPADLARPQHYQPIWQQTIVAATTARLFRQIRTIEQNHHIWPVASTTDSAVYLLTAHTSRTLREEAKKKADHLGVLRPEGRRVLSDEDKQLLLQRRGEPVERVLDLDDVKERA